MERNSTSIFFYYTVSGPPRTVYTYRDTYSLKIYMTNLHTQMSSNQSEERTMFFTRKKKEKSNHNRERCFFKCEKNNTSNQKPQRCVSFAPKFQNSKIPPSLKLLRRHLTTKENNVEFFS